MQLDPSREIIVVPKAPVTKQANISSDALKKRSSVKSMAVIYAKTPYRLCSILTRGRDA
jgi:hypothetical protein